MIDIKVYLKESICCQGSAKYNEDIIGTTPKGVWVLDGATGLNNKNLVCKESDAKWYVTWWNEYLNENIDKNKNLKDIVKEGIRLINKEYEEKLENSEITKLDKPSSSLCVVKFHQDNIEYLILGDCALHTLESDKVSIIKTQSLQELDNKVYEKMESLPDLWNISHEEIKDRVMDIIINNRLKKNTKEGYWILEFEEEAVDNALYGSITIDKNISIMLTSDGFSCISDRYALIKDKELIKEVKRHGVSNIYSKLRGFEEEEFSVNKFPRFKIKDDSSCIFLDINAD